MSELSHTVLSALAGVALGFVVAARAFRAASSDSSADSSSSADAARASSGAAGGAAGGGGAASDATEPQSPISRLVSRIPFAMPKDRRRITVFCGASTPSGARGEAILAATRALGRELARRNIDLVYGGGNVGLMGEVSRAVHEAGGNVYGIIPRALAAREVSGHMVQPQHEIIVDTMHERKQLLAELGSGFIALPGGYGTFEELMEAITWTQLKVHDKLIGMLNVDGFYAPLEGLITTAVGEGFIKPEAKDIAIFEADPVKLVDAILEFKPPSGSQFQLHWGASGSALKHT